MLVFYRIVVFPNTQSEHIRNKSKHYVCKFVYWSSLFVLMFSVRPFKRATVVRICLGFAYPIAKFSNEDDQLNYAAKIVSGALDYKNLLDKQLLPPGD
jgi:hypothetical protein